ncbi:MAG: hypothetical protein ACR2KT_02960 [Methylocella sp.]
MRLGIGSDAAAFAPAAGAVGGGATGRADDSGVARAPLPLPLDRAGGVAVAVAAALGAPLAAPPRTPRTRSAIGGSTTLS